MRIDMNRMFVDDEIREAALEVIESGRYVKGPKAKEFEEAFSELVGGVESASCSSGSGALMLAFGVLGIGAGDEVIVPSHTFVATVNGFWHYGARPVFADIDPRTYTIDPERVEDAITERTKAIVPVHLYGHPADMGRLLEISEEHGVPIVGDAAQAHGSKYRGEDVGRMGLMTCYSFFPSKIVTVGGEGGMVTSKDPEFIEKVKAMRNHGREKGEKFVSSFPGFNMRLPEIGAAMGIVQLKHMKEWIDRRRDIARVYSQELEGVSDLMIPVEEDWGYHTYYLYVIRTAKRDDLADHLRRMDISTGVHYPVPVHKMPFIGDSPDLPETEKAVSEILSLPMHPLLTAEEQKEVIEGVRSFF